MVSGVQVLGKPPRAHCVATYFINSLRWVFTSHSQRKSTCGVAPDYGGLLRSGGGSAVVAR